MIRCIQCELPIEQELAPALIVFRGAICDPCDEENKRERWRAPDFGDLDPQECCVESGTPCHRALPVRMAEVPNSEEY